MKAVPSLAVRTDRVPLDPTLQCRVWPTTSYMVPASLYTSSRW
jgi:hypothetical protein